MKRKKEKKIAVLIVVYSDLIDTSLTVDCGGLTDRLGWAGLMGWRLYVCVYVCVYVSQT